MIWFAVLVGSTLAGIVQTVTGFGAVVTMMMIFPFLFTMIDAPMLALAINTLYVFVLCWKYREHLDWRIALPPTIIYSVVGFLVTGLVGSVDLKVLVIVFAIFLIILSLYLVFVSSRIKLQKPSPLIGVGISFLSGVTSGLFAIGGPPMAPYMLAATKDHKSYLACMQLMFSISSLMNLIGRMVNGIFNYSLWPYIAAGSVCILVGMKFGEAITDRLNPDLLRRIVHIGVGVSGLILLLQNI